MKEREGVLPLSEVQVHQTSPKCSFSAAMHVMCDATEQVFPTVIP